jgi:hypothetical protein
MRHLDGLAYGSEAWSFRGLDYAYGVTPSMHLLATRTSKRGAIIGCEAYLGMTSTAPTVRLPRRRIR